MQRFPKFDYKLVTLTSIEKALDLVSHYDLHRKPDEPVNISVLWDYFDLRMMDLPLSTWGFTMDAGENGIIIAVNNLLPPPKQLFTFGHEIGHVIMQHPDQLNACLTDEQQRLSYDRAEVEATTVAAYLLVPKEAVVSKSACLSIEQVAARYFVPDELVIIRWTLYKRTGM